MTSVGKFRECGICRDLGLRSPRFNQRNEYRRHLQTHWNKGEGRRSSERSAPTPPAGSPQGKVGTAVEVHAGGSTERDSNG